MNLSCPSGQDSLLYSFNSLLNAVIEHILTSAVCQTLCWVVGAAKEQNIVPALKFPTVKWERPVSHALLI